MGGTQRLSLRERDAAHAYAAGQWLASRYEPSRLLKVRVTDLARECGVDAEVMERALGKEGFRVIEVEGVRLAYARARPVQAADDDGPDAEPGQEAARET
jgi:hypothetical protein